MNPLPHLRRRLSRPTLWLLLFALIAVFGVKESLDLLPHGMARETTKTHLERFLDHDQGGDSWYPMSVAYEYLRTGPTRPDDLYAEVFGRRGVKFQYPPSALLLFRALDAADPETMEIVSERGGLWNHLPISWAPFLNRLTWGATGLAALAAVALLFVARRRWPRPEGDRPTEPGRGLADTFALGLIGFLLAIHFYPLLRCYTLGQIQPLLALAATLAFILWTWRDGPRRITVEAAAGALVGLCCLVKPQFGYLLLWGLLRRRWGFCTGLAVVLAAGLAASIAAFGWGNHWDYLGVLRTLSRRGESYFPNQSMNGLLHRLLHNGNNLEWIGDAFPPYNRIVYAGTLISSIVLLALPLVPPRNRAARGGVFDFAFATLPVTLASPVAWDHHYSLLLPVFVLLFARVAAAPRFPRTRPTVALVAGWLLVAHFYQWPKAFADTSLNFLQSYMYFGGLIVFGLVWYCRGCLDAAESSSADALAS